MQGCLYEAPTWFSWMYIDAVVIARVDVHIGFKRCALRVFEV